MSVREFAKLEKVSYFTVLRWIKTGKLKALRREKGCAVSWEITPAAIKHFTRPLAGRPRK